MSLQNFALSRYLLRIHRVVSYVAIIICMPYYYLSILWRVREMADINFILWICSYNIVHVFRASQNISMDSKALAACAFE